MISACSKHLKVQGDHGCWPRKHVYSGFQVAEVCDRPWIRKSLLESSSRKCLFETTRPDVDSVQVILYLRSCQPISKLDDTRLCTLLSQILLDQLQVQMGSGIPISTTYPMETGALRALIWRSWFEELDKLGSKRTWPGTFFSQKNRTSHLMAILRRKWW